MTTATLCVYAATLAGVIAFPLGWALGRADRRHAKQAEHAAVAGYGRAEVIPPTADVASDVPADRAVDLDDYERSARRSRPYAVIEEAWANHRADDHVGWDDPDTFAELRGLSAGRHAARDPEAGL